jgi:DNA-binding transcriptional regulator PaaX
MTIRTNEEEDARAIIAREYHGSRNIMTPNVLSYHKLPNGAAELSKGTGFHEEPSFGVTVVRQAPNGETSRDRESSRVFYSLVDAKRHIAELKRIAASYTKEEVN